MPVMPGAEAYVHDGGPTGVLLCHGFTGSPQSLRPWAEYLAAAGLGVSLPRLPGHGTTWQEMARTRWEDWFAEADRAFDELQARSDEIFLMGLSMGGCLALRLAELRGQAVSGLVLVNPSLVADNKVLFALIPALPVWENVIYPLIPRGMRHRQRVEIADRVLAQVGLAERRNALPTELSGGEQQRVAIARAVVNHPAILLADEPTGNLDTENSKAVLEILRDLNERTGQTILMITHNPEAADYGHRTISMRDGRIV